MSRYSKLFLSKGVTWAVLWIEGKQPDAIDLLTILVMDGKQIWVQSFIIGRFCAILASAYKHSCVYKLYNSGRYDH